MKPAVQPSQLRALPMTRLQLLAGWAMVQSAPSYVWQPRTVEQIRAVLALARQHGRTVALRGTGNSYTDAALNTEDIVIDLAQMRQILVWDAALGRITVEPGVTIQELWQATIADGWWPQVVPGTMRPTIGGCVAMNVHGKNAWLSGSFGEHVLAIDVLTPDGEIHTLTAQHHPDQLQSYMGSIGLFGIVTQVTLQLKRVASGLVTVQQKSANSLAGMFDRFASEITHADYLVGWIDGFAKGAALGRGLIDSATVSDRSDPRYLQPNAQAASTHLLGIIPRSQLWRGMAPLFTDVGMRVANNAQYTKGSVQAQRGPRYVPHAQFHFYHDYVPNWKRAWLPGGLRQLQVFVPQAAAPSIFKELLERSQQAGVHPYLCVMKQHRNDNTFLLPYQCDGFSLSLDYRVTASNRRTLDRLLYDLCRTAIEAGSRLYLAKDDVLDATMYAQSIGHERIERFLAMKRHYDATAVLQSNLYRRVLQQ